MGRRVAPGESAIVKALAEEDEIGDRIVDGENDLESRWVSNWRLGEGAKNAKSYHGRQDALQDSTQNIEDIAK